MYKPEDIRIKKSIIHILDSTLDIPVLSGQLMPSTPDLYEFLSIHVSKILNNEALRTCTFIQDQNLIYADLKKFDKSDSNFISLSQNIANIFFSVMHENVDIPPADLAIILFSINQEDFIGILKMNYVHSYIHYTENVSNNQINKIIRQQTTLPNRNQAITEATFIHLSDLSIKLLEKKYDMNGEKVLYMSKHILKCSGDISNKDKFKILKKTTDQITKKFFDENVEKKLEIKKQLYDNVSETGEINIEKFVDDAFENNVELKNEFKETIQKKGLETPSVQLSEKTINRSIQKQSIKTDTGIEITIPLDEYGRSNNIEFINNPDGTISILIKNINKIK